MKDSVTDRNTVGNNLRNITVTDMFLNCFGNTVGTQGKESLVNSVFCCFSFAKNPTLLPKPQSSKRGFGHGAGPTRSWTGPIAIGSKEGRSVSIFFRWDILAVQLHCRRSFREPQMGGQIRRGRIWRVWGAPIFSPEVPKCLFLKGFGASGRKIGAPQKRQIQPRRIWPPICGPLRVQNQKTPVCSYFCLYAIFRQFVRNFRWPFAIHDFKGCFRERAAPDPLRHPLKCPLRGP